MGYDDLMSTLCISTLPFSATSQKPVRRGNVLNPYNNTCAFLAAVTPFVSSFSHGFCTSYDVSFLLGLFAFYFALESRVTARFAWSGPLRKWCLLGTSAIVGIL